uniref:Uncharacterized protein n=1 Tax=Arundo donax TaxID=35708 RepID=A0A0A9HKE7_ARUDO
MPPESAPAPSSLRFPPPPPLRRTMWRRRCVCPRRNDTCANSHRSGSTFRKP